MGNTQHLYRTYSQYLTEKYGEKVYKLPVNLPITCPNRDGKLSPGGCTFCAEGGTVFENLPDFGSVKQQINGIKKQIREKYKANKYIAYFQNFSNTYMSIDVFKGYIEDAVMEDIVEIAISTRPDCIKEEYLEFLADLRLRKGVEISLELGLQTANYHTLNKINRGHTLGEFIDAVLAIKRHGFEICAHLILNLPWDDMDDVIENAKVISALNIEQVKLHALYIMENTMMGEQYKAGEIKLISVEEYKERVITFLEYLYPDIVIQRLICSLISLEITACKSRTIVGNGWGPITEPRQ
jgi:radical SAM protein (TIGR01212 family)